MLNGKAGTIFILVSNSQSPRVKCRLGERKEQYNTDRASIPYTISNVDLTFHSPDGVGKISNWAD